MKLSVQIKSREAIQFLLPVQYPDNAAVISFRDSGMKPVDFPETVRAFHVEVDDIEPAEADSGTFAEVNQLAEFTHKAVVDDCNIICQCVYGVSRSSGCAAAIREFFGKDGIMVFADERYYPSKYVFRKVYAALKATAADSPQLAVFWYADGKFIGQQDVLNGGSVSYYGDYAQVDVGHYDVWERYRPHTSFPDCEYEYFPRGRVLFNAKLRNYKVIADRKIIDNPDVRLHLREWCGLPITTVFEWDEHYQSGE
jgi:hypothetical protein